KRCFGVTFETAVFTNFTQDHLDYHKTMENYARAKQTLFSQCKKGVFNKDDPMYKFMAENCPDSVFYSLKDESSDFYAGNAHFDKHGSCFDVYCGGGKVSVKIGIPGLFSVYNGLAAFACAALEGISGADISEALASMKPVPGRCEVLKTNTPFTVIIDYAHSPDSIENILRCVRSFTKGRVVALFGCGGDRDRLKRPLMAAAAAENSDYVIITSDNPRTENPNRIIEDILPGISQKNIPCAVIPDRTHAIEFAVKNALPGDSIVLCGKGHETYQIIGSKKLSYDERRIVNRAVKEFASVY
ncbi:MAG: UDP-N-acetylmuramoyl-L-alanyl-D-glutamate--2,6-diaminopimelate ligase, partial [Clostridia bacterium]|nr:UDP-N-acetylmuramoyl-L-alanyl-D-glutamate--2,6-diaminopimelate ligase [Clostridia bacterium]